MNYYPFHIADFALHTSHLTLEEEGVYRRLLDYYYDTESPIPEKTDLVIRRLRLKGYEELVGSILEEFFVLQDDGWHNLRADIEIADYNSKADRARQNGKKGGRPKKNKGSKTQPVNLANPEETESKANQEPRTNNQEPETKDIGSSADADKPPPKKSRSDYSDEFEAIWQAYPKREGANPKNKAHSAYKARLAEGVSPEHMASGVSRYAAYAREKGNAGTEFVMQAQRFFGKERAFENDWMITEAGNEGGQRNIRKSKSDRDDDAMRQWLQEQGYSDDDGESLADTEIVEHGAFASGQH